MMRLDHAWNSLVTMTFQSASVCLIVGIGLLLLRKSAAATRHLVLILAMSALLIVPFLALFLPHWQVPLTRTPPALNLTAERALSPTQTLILSTESDTPLSSPRSALVPAASAPTRLTRPLHSLAHRSASLEPIRFSSSSPQVRRASASIWQTARFQQSVLALWLLGVTLALLRLLAGLIGTVRVTRRETVSDPLLSQTVAQIQGELGLERAVTIRKTVANAGLPAPLTWGLFRPTVLLPPAFLEWPRERQRMVVLHELAHIQRADWLAQMLVQITLSLYWFHPLVWWAAHRLHAESERACDDTVLLTGVAPSAYAEALLEVLRALHPSRRSAAHPAILSMAQPPIKARVQAILSQQRRQRPARPAMLLASAITALCAVLLASIQVQAVRAPITPVHPPHIPGNLGTSNPPLDSVSAARPIVSIPELSVSGPPPASPRANVERTTTPSQESQDEQDIAMLRKKLDTLELLLVHCQEENARLRQQIQLLRPGP